MYKAHTAPTVTMLCLLVLSCGSSTVQRTWPPSAAMLVAVDLGVDRAGLTQEGDAMALLEGPPSGPITELTHYPNRPDRTTIYLISSGGTGVGTYPTFVFGNAPTRASRVELALPGAIGAVQSGFFLIAIPRTDVKPGDLHWSFFSESGLVAQGDGIRS